MGTPFSKSDGDLTLGSISVGSGQPVLCKGPHMETATEWPKDLERDRTHLSQRQILLESRRSRFSFVLPLPVQMTWAENPLTFVSVCMFSRFM